MDIYIVGAVPTVCSCLGQRNDHPKACTRFQYRIGQGLMEGAGIARDCFGRVRLKHYPRLGGDYSGTWRSWAGWLKSALSHHDRKGGC